MSRHWYAKQGHYSTLVRLCPLDHVVAKTNPTNNLVVDSCDIVPRLQMLDKKGVGNSQPLAE